MSLTFVFFHSNVLTLVVGLSPAVGIAVRFGTVVREALCMASFIHTPAPQAASYRA